MKKLLYSIALILCITIISQNNLFATSARMYGLGLRDSDTVTSTVFDQTFTRIYNYDWMIQSDDEYIHTNPAFIPQIDEFIYINTNQTSSDFGSGGILLKFTKNFGIMFSTGNEIDSRYQYDTENAELTKDQFNLKTGMKFGMFSMGWALSYSTSTDRDTSNDSETMRYYFYNKFGFQFDFGKTLDLDFSLHVAIPYVKEIEGDEAVYESDGAFDFGLNTRVNLSITRRQRLHIFLAYGNQNHSALGYDPATDVVTSHKVNNVAFTLGVSDEIKLTKTSFAFIGFSFTATGDNVESSTSANSYPVNSYDKELVAMVLGIEGKLTEKLTARFGANRRIYNYVDDDRYTSNSTDTVENDVTTNEEASTKLFIGFSFEMKNFKVDWVINNSMLTDGPYFISGNNNGTGHNTVETSFSLTYKFNSIGLITGGDDEDKKDSGSSNRRRRRRR